MDPAEVARLLADRLEAAHIPYTIGGAIAYAYWGVARGTHAVDINLFIAPEQFAETLDIPIPAGLTIDRTTALTSAEERGNARGFVGDVPVDMFVDSIPLHEEAARRVATVSLFDRPIRILSAEDLVVLKLLFFRGKDIVDIDRVLSLQGDRLDRAYIRRWLVDSVGEEDERVQKWNQLCTTIPVPLKVDEQ
ncbi:MAG: nucleotidyltransferase family protein [Deltaproteobacteria bacterium]|nr:nucleotidyltransferase family protein [Deltaproteobacteria bacterium]